MPESLKDKTIKGTFWTGLERFWVQGVQFLVMLVIARILSPKDYGLIGMISVFIAISQSLIESGFSQALIRKKDADEVDYNTVFYFNIVMSIIFYGILYLISPAIASFYNEPILCSVTRVISLVVIINAFNIVQGTIFSIQLDFKKQAHSSMMAAIISGGISIILAKMGFGVWTLVYQQLISCIVITIVLWSYSKWRPKWIYSWKSFNNLFSFGLNLVISGLIDTIYFHSYVLVIGKVYNAISLGYYSRASHYAQLPVSNFNSIFFRVTYPVLCKLQDDDSKLREIYKKMLRISVFILFPIMCGLAGAAYPVVVALVGEKWAFSSVLLVPICLARMWYPLHAINMNVLKVKGRTDLFLKIEIIKKILSIIILIVSIPLGLVYMCYGMIISSIASLAINSFYTGRLIQLGFWKQMKDISHILLVSLCMFVLIRIVNIWIDNVYIQLLIDIIVGAAFYFGISFLFHFKEIEYIQSLRKNKRETSDSN